MKTKQGENFKRLLVASGISPASLARTLNVSPQNISSWYNRGVSARYSSSVAEILGTTQEEVSATVKSHDNIDPSMSKADRRFLESKQELLKSIAHGITNIDDPIELNRAKNLIHSILGI